MSEFIYNYVSGFAIPPRTIMTSPSLHAGAQTQNPYLDQQELQPQQPKA